MNSLDIVLPCYNCSSSINRVLRSVNYQLFKNELKVTIYVINDASTDNTIEILKPQSDSLKVVNLDINCGRARARNIGARHGNSELILFLDSDCELGNKESLNYLLEKLSQPTAVAFGSVRSRGEDFWSKYFNLVSEKREENTLKGKIASLTSAFFIIKRDLFEEAGGFNEEYKHYGFEDRELFLRLINTGAKIGFDERSYTYHDSIESIFSVTEKLYEAGMYSSKIFEQTYPDIYRNMIYGKIDARLHPLTIKPFIILFSPFKGLIINLCNKIIICRPIPFFFKAIIVKFASALAYSIGTNSNAR